jgi:hypothetical protein
MRKVVKVKEGYKPRKKLEGTRFGSWLVLEYVLQEGRFKCLCDCGTVRNVRTRSLWGSESRSCGCASTKIRVASFAQIKERRASFITPINYEPHYAG